MGGGDWGPAEKILPGSEIYAQKYIRNEPEKFFKMGKKSKINSEKINFVKVAIIYQLIVLVYLLYLYKCH